LSLRHEFLEQGKDEYERKCVLRIVRAFETTENVERRREEDLKILGIINWREGMGED